MKKPNPGDYPDFYARYIDLVPPKPLLRSLEEVNLSTIRMLGRVQPDEEEFAYADGKWTIKEVVVHLCDSERVFAYRILRIARGDATPMPGFEQDPYIANANASGQTLSDLVIAFANIRRSTIDLLNSCTPEMLDRTGKASGWKVSGLALAYVICGHEIHHQQVIQELYLSALPH